MTNQILLIAITMLAGVSAWSDEVHHIIARIAWDIMKEENPYSITCSDHKLSYLQEAFPKATQNEGKYPFVESATFMMNVYKPEFMKKDTVMV